MFGNSVLRSYAKNLPIRQFCVTQLRKELADDINDFSTDALLSFGGGSTDMGSAADMGMAVKSLVLAGFFCPNMFSVLNRLLVVLALSICCL